MLLSAAPLCLARQKQEPGAGDRSLLWKISGKGLQRPSYLFGTLHIICPGDYVWTPAMDEALKKSEKVAFEMDMDDPSLQQEMAAGMMLKGGKTLRDFYTEEEYKKLTSLMAQQGMPVPMMQQFTPFALISFLYLKAVSCPIPDSYEGHLTKDAQAQHKEILGLETVAEQMKVIEDMNPDTVARSVLQMVEHIDSFKNVYDTMLSLYKKQDLPALYGLIIQSPDYKDDLDALLFSRNRKWVPLIEDMVHTQATFIAVGAGHLWGDKGVIALLREQGYQVEPVR